MSTNGVNTAEDADMTDCDGEKVVTMMDVLQEQEEFEEDVNAVLGASDDKNCTYTKGYIKRQAIYACLTCCLEAKDDSTKRAGVCLACSLNCHENHELVELYTKRNFRCDCGNPKFGTHPCQYVPNKLDLNEDNNYNQNFSGLYCTCQRPYPDPECTEEDEMIQCIICEDWLHAAHLEATVPANEQYSEMICRGCMEKNEFLHDYSDLAVNNESGDFDIVTVSSIKVATINDTNESDRAQDKPMTDVNEFADISDGKENKNGMDVDNIEANEESINKESADGELSAPVVKVDNAVDKSDGKENKNGMDVDKIEANEESSNKESADGESSVPVVKVHNAVDKSDGSNEIVEDNITSDKGVNKITAESEEKEPLDTENTLEFVSNPELEADKENPNVINTTTQLAEPENVDEEQKTISDETIRSDILPGTETMELDTMSENPKPDTSPDTENNTASQPPEKNIVTDEVDQANGDYVSSIADEEKKGNDEEFNTTTETESKTDVDINKEVEPILDSNASNINNMESDECKTEKVTAEKETDAEDDYNIESESKNEITEDESADNQNAEEMYVDENICESKDKDDTNVEKIDSDTNSKEVVDGVHDKDVDNSENNDTQVGDDVNEKEVDSETNIFENDSGKCNAKEVGNDVLNKEVNISENNDKAVDSGEVDTSDSKDREVNTGEIDTNNSNDKDAQQNGTSEHSPPKNGHTEDSDAKTNKQENKRKLSIEQSESEEVNSKKVKLDESKSCSRPKGVKKRYIGATFWPSNFRQKLCTCNECISMYKDLSVLFLTDPEDTVTAYETLGKERVDGKAASQYEKGLEALSSLDRIQQINALTEYNKMRDKLLDFLKSFKDRKEIVKEDDIKAFFAGMKPKREPDGVYFCR